MSSLNEMLWKLTSKYTKNPDSNIGKIIKLYSEQYDAIKKDLSTQIDWKDINKAQGKALDDIGRMFGIPRGTADDEQYRVRIKIGISKNISDGTINSVIEILATTLAVELKTVHIESMWTQGVPNTIKISNIPYKALVAAGMTQDELIEITKSIVAAGINVETLELEGTFRFSKFKDQNEISPDTGFYNEATGTGGTFGAIMKVE